MLFRTLYQYVHFNKSIFVFIYDYHQVKELRDRLSGRARAITSAT